MTPDQQERHWSAARLDDLGRRLTQQQDPADVTEFQQYLLSLESAAEQLRDEIRELFPIFGYSRYQVTARVKRKESILAKLTRAEQPLSQLTDLIGIRVIVPGLREQRYVAGRLHQVYKVLRYDDKNEQPKFGYRAVHLDVSRHGQTLEIQVQTEKQHRWQEISETAARYDRSIKYGGRPMELKQALQNLSDLGRQADTAESEERRDIPETQLGFEIAAHGAEETIQKHYGHPARH